MEVRSASGCVSNTRILKHPQKREKKGKKKREKERKAKERKGEERQRKAKERKSKEKRRKSTGSYDGSVEEEIWTCG